MNLIQICKMETILMNSGNSKTSHSRRLYLLDEKMLKRSDKYVALTNLTIYYTAKNTRKCYLNNKFKISAPTFNNKFDSLDGSYSVSGIQDYFETLTDNPPIRKYEFYIDR